MKTLLLTASLLITSISTSFAQSPALDQSFLFDEEDVVVRAQDFNESEDIKKEACKSSQNRYSRDGQHQTQYCKQHNLYR